MEESKKTLKERVIENLNAPIGKDIAVVLSYVINKTSTDKDNIIVEEIDDIIQVIAEKVKSLTIKPTPKEAKVSVVNILTLVTDRTKNKWDNIIISIIKRFV